MRARSEFLHISADRACFIHLKKIPQKVVLDLFKKFGNNRSPFPLSAAALLEMLLLRSHITLHMDIHVLCNCRL